MSKEEEKEVEEELQKEKEAQNKKAKKDKKEKKSKEEEEAIKPLPDDIKGQLNAKMELAVLNKKKERLREKLKDLTEELDSELYEYDFDYKKKINRKLDAVKEIKKELFKEEEELRDQLGPSGQFRMDELETTLDVQRQQLIDLKRNYKRHKIKKNVYKELKKEYAKIFREAEEELNELRAGVIRWLSEVKSELTTYESKIQKLKARYKAGEIEKNDLELKQKEYEKKIEQCEQRIKILELYTKPKKRGFFR
jgi:chromosome segregation ATPase